MLNQAARVMGILLWWLAAAACSDELSPPTGTDVESPSKLAGMWRFEFQMPEGFLRCPIEFQQKEGAWSVTIHNGDEQIGLSDVEASPTGTVVRIPHYDSRIELTWDREGGERLHGFWTKRRNASDWARLNVTARRWTTERAEENSPYLGRWRVQFGSSPDDAVAVFEAADTKGRVTGTFLTTTGDYRYLAGACHDGTLALQCFDGAHAFLFTARQQSDGSLRGDFWSGNWWHDTWSATRDDAARLPDPFQMTRWNESTRLADLAYPDLDGRKRRLSEKSLRGSVTILEVFGSWCPNCHDAAVLLDDLLREFGPRGFKVIGLAFEVTGDTARDAAQVRRYVQRHHVTYPVLLAGVSDKEQSSQQFPLLDRIRSYPTFVFLDQAGEVRAIYTGFSGPATGKAYDRMRDEFRTTVADLLPRRRGTRPMSQPTSQIKEAPDGSGTAAPIDN